MVEVDFWRDNAPERQQTFKHSNITKPRLQERSPSPLKRQVLEQNCCRTAITKYLRIMLMRTMVGTNAINSFFQSMPGRISREVNEMFNKGSVNERTFEHQTSRKLNICSQNLGSISSDAPTLLFQIRFWVSTHRLTFTKKSLTNRANTKSVCLLN